MSNFGPKALTALLPHVKSAISVNQIEYNVFAHDEPTIAACRAHNISVQSYSPLGGAHGGKRSVFTDPTVTSIAAKHNVSAAQVALRWIVQRGDLFTVLSSSAAHQANDAALWGFALEDGEMASLGKLQTAS